MEPLGSFSTALSLRTVQLPASAHSLVRSRSGNVELLGHLDDAQAFAFAEQQQDPQRVVHRTDLI